MKLLTPTPPAELPGEALLARLRCRRAGIDLTGRSQMSQDHAPGQPLPQAVDWVYRRLNARLKKQLEPYLDLLAVRSLVLMLRYRLAGEPLPLALEREPLLNIQIKKLLTPDLEPELIVVNLARSLQVEYPFFENLATTWRRQGPGGVEQQLLSGILRHSLSTTRDATVRKAIRYLLDMRNLLIVMKFWRWRISTPPELTVGGQLTAENLLRIWKNHDTRRLATLASSMVGVPTVECEATVMERHLLSGLGRQLQRAGRDPLSVGVILDYLWRAQLASYNHILRQTLTPDSEELLEEVMLL